MPYFIDTKKALYFLDDSKFVSMLPSDCIPISDQQAKAIEAENAKPSLADKWKAYQVRAQAALDKSDTTLLRSMEKGIPMPLSWINYRAALRVIIAAPTGDPDINLPVKPPYP